MKRALKMWKRTVTTLFLLSQRRDAMKCHSSAASLALAALAVLGLVGPVAAGEQVPFLGRFAGVVTVTVTPGFPPIASANVNATGVATHLGQFTLAIPHSVIFTPTFPRTSSGFYNFVAANGDTLSASFTGLVNPIPGVPGALAAVESANITGGTGRFAGATGDFTVERVALIDPATGTGTTIGSFYGTISSPGAAQR